jgi:prevent-host-death family protein
MKTVSATEAKRSFANILREVRGGETVLITLRGQPIATIAPPTKREIAWHAQLERLDGRPAQNIPITWTRDDLYDDDP